MIVIAMRKSRTLAAGFVRTAFFRHFVLRVFVRFAGLRNSHKCENGTIPVPGRVRDFITMLNWTAYSDIMCLILPAQ